MTWGVTIKDRVCEQMIVHLIYKAEFYWQIRELVYLSSDEAVGYDLRLHLI